MKAFGSFNSDAVNHAAQRGSISISLPFSFSILFVCLFVCLFFEGFSSRHLQHFYSSVTLR